VIADASVLQAGSQLYADTYSETFGAMLAAKFGILELSDADAPWINSAFELLHQAEVDMTLFFRNLAMLDLQQPSLEPLYPAFYRDDLLQQHQAAWENWLQQYCQRLQQDNLPTDERRSRMDAVNPRFVLRNYLAQQAIDAAASGDNCMLLELLEVLRRPYDEQPSQARFAEKRPEWARHKAGCSMLSCSS
jgi:uncharacterized protein YdiU (UPF0061 family)